jgi:O-antigen/teichoic acid export membrane protein
MAVVGVTMVMQIVVPRVLLARWGDAGYAFTVAVQGFAAYVSVADAGVLLYLSRRLAVLRASGDEAAALSLTRGGLEAFAWLAGVGTLIVSVAFVLSGHSVWSTLARTCALTPGWALAAALSQIVWGATSLALGGWSSAVDQGRARYARVPGAGLVRHVIVTIATLGLAESGWGPGATLLAVSALGIAYECARFALALSGEPPLREMKPDPVREILRDSRGSLVYYLATTTQTGLPPYVAASISPSAVSVAVPARTLANGARSVSTALSIVIWVPVAARLSELTVPVERLRFWRRNSPVLSAVHLGGILALLALAPLVVPIWLPSKSSQILALLPAACVEQGAYVATIPSVVLLQATGRFGTLGGATMAAAIAAVVGTVVLVPRYGAFGFTSSGAAAATLIFAPVVIAAEWSYWRSTGTSATSMLASRLVLALLAIGCALAYAAHPWASVAALSLLFGGAAFIALRARRGSTGATG